MKRTVVEIVFAVVVCLCGVLAGQQTGSAPPPARPPAPSAANKPKLEPSLWVTLKRGQGKIKVLRGCKKIQCPTDKNKRRPEIVMVRLSENDYAEFQKDPRKFVNDLGIFSCPVRSLERLVRTEQKPKAESGGDPTLLISHEPDCGGYFYETS